MNINLKNYQSIKEGNIDLSGFVGIIGSNNSGKTAVMRAIRDFVLNDFSKDKIHQGEKEGIIDVDGVKLKRIPSTSSLLVGNEEKNKLEGKPIPDFIDLKDFIFINNDKIKNYLIQFSFQREQLPPFNLSSSQLFYIFSMLFDLETINKMFIHIKDKIRENENEIKYLKGKTDEILKQKLRIEEIKIKLPDKDKLNRIEYKWEKISELLKDINRKIELEIKLKELKKVKEKININRLINLMEYIKLIALLNKRDILKQIKEKTQKYYLYLYEFIRQKLINFKQKIGIINQPIELNYLNNILKKLYDIKERNRIELLNIENTLHTEFQICPLCGK